MNKRELNIITNHYKIGNIISYERLHSSQNEVYKLNTIDNCYVLKIFTKDAIGNYYHLNKRKEQIRISGILNRYGIRCIQPLRRKQNIFFNWHERYYLVYPYLKSKTLEEVRIDKNIIAILATTQAKIHKMRIHTTLPSNYHRLNIDLKVIKNKKKKQVKLYKKLCDNEEALEELIEQNNKVINILKQNLCVSHNDYKRLNILYEKGQISLVDFDAMGLVNPTCAMIESAFTFAYQNGKINMNNFKNYLVSYQKEYGKINDFDDALWGAMNGKLQWFSYIVSKNREKETINMIDELMTYYNNMGNFKEVFRSIKDKG